MEYLFSVFIVLGIVAFIYLLVGGLGLNELLPKAVSGFLIRISVTIILTAISLSIYDLLGIPGFAKIAMAVLGIGLFLAIRAPLFDRMKREYRKKHGVVTSEDEWICKSCGEINRSIDIRCSRCGKSKPNRTAEPAESESWICKECGRKNFIKDKNCTTCGQRQDNRYT
jgi:ribosomal protein L37E